ncbi:MAG: YbdD/YjiX family protein [Acidovorax sp.]
MERWPDVVRHIGQTARAVAGLPDYGAYLAHFKRAHPDHEPMSCQEFFRRHQNARFGADGRDGFRCCS